VVLDGAWADEQPCADLGVGGAVAGEPGDLGLSQGELVAGLGGAFAGGLAGGQQLARGALGERLEARGREQLVSDAQLLAGVQPPALAAQPLAVEQMRAGELHAHAGAPEPLDRLAVKVLAVGQQRARARLDPQRPLSAARAGGFREPPRRTLAMRRSSMCSTGGRAS
jgi:hypothetical protein